jgi:hypothetical protein
MTAELFRYMIQLDNRQAVIIYKNEIKGGVEKKFAEASRHEM